MNSYGGKWAMNCRWNRCTNEGLNEWRIMGIHFELCDTHDKVMFTSSPDLREVVPVSSISHVIHGS